MTCGEAVVKLLERYGVDTVFGIPGVHNLELYRGLEASSLNHILTRHEQGAGFMADGYARASGKAGVCFVISGPGITNITTPMGQAFSDSVPMLVISSDAPSSTLGKGLGELHEVTDLTAVTKPLTAFSATVTAPNQVPELMARAFALFASERPRPVHISVPLDILAQSVTESWDITKMPEKPSSSPPQIARAVELLSEAKQPVIIVGGGFERSVEASEVLASLAERLGTAVVTTSAGKGALSEAHPLSLGASVTQKATQTFISQADVVLVLGSELATTDCFAGHYEFTGKLIHVDIDPSKLADQFAPDLAICADAKFFVTELLATFPTKVKSLNSMQALIKAVKEENDAGLVGFEKEHQALLATLRNVLPEDAIFTADMTQLAYSAVSLLAINKPKCWFYPAGYGTLGFALPAAIGAKLARPDRAVVVLVGDYGFQYTLQDLATAVEQKQALTIILWNNEGLGEIESSMKHVNINPVQVKPHNPDFIALAKAYGCDALTPTSKEDFEQAITDSLSKEKPTLIEVKQGSSWIRFEG